MKSKLLVSIAGFILTLFLSGFFSPLVSPPPKNVDLIIMKIDSAWKVVHVDDHKNTKVKVKKKDTITWTIQGSDAYFQFPEKLFDPADASDSLHNDYKKFLKDGKKLKLKIGSSASEGTYEYAVFCTADGSFAEGDSPPTIVIE